MIVKSLESESIDCINDMPKDNLDDVMNHLEKCNEKLPFVVTTIEELYRNIDESMDDIKNGRTMPFEEAMIEIRRELAKYGV